MLATTLPTRPTSTTGLLGAPSGELVLKICGGEHDGRVLRLTAAKCTIGSAPGCTLRLRARGIRPVHALILRGPNAAIVRCWSPDAQLNERGFSEAQLEIGDKLQFGPISLSVVELATQAPVRQFSFEAPTSITEVPPPRPTRRPNRNRRKQLFDVLRQERQQQSELQATIENQCERLAALEQQLEQLQAEMDAAPLEVIPAEPVDDQLTQQFTRTIEQLRNELDSAAKRRSMEQQSLARQKAAWEEQTEQRLQAELAKHRAELQLLQQQASAAATTSAGYERQIEALDQQRVTLSREVESLKLALETKSKAEELARQNAASQLEQLSQTFALVSRERDELFERLHTEEPEREAAAIHWQAQIEEVRRQANAQIAEAQIAAQLQISRMREEFAKREHQLDEDLIARTTNESQRSVADAERIQKLTAELEAVRAEARQSSTAAQQQQEGFTQVRKRWEAEIAALNHRLQESEQAVHAARTSSCDLQAAVLAEAEQARAQRDSVREQMLRQQQDWTEFRSRLESAASEERELARIRYVAIEEELNTRTQDQIKAQAECAALQEQLVKLQIELEQTQESLFAAEHGTNQRLQQMTISMETLQLDRGSAQSQIEQERAEWDRERDSLASCVSDLQQELAKLTEKVHTFEEQSQKEAESRLRLSSTETKLQAAQQQLAQWQTTAEQAQQNVDELSRAVARLQQQEQAWLIEREQLDKQQEDSTGRLQQLEASITEFRSRLESAASEERELARIRYVAIEEELNTRTQDQIKAQAECAALQEQLVKLQIELEQTQESLFAAEHGTNQRLQQMTISMETLQLDRGSAQSQIEQERAEWDRERDSLASCVSDLQQELAKLTEKVHTFEEQSQKEAESRLRLSSTETKLQAAQQQLAQWQTTAEQAQQNVDELSRAVARLQQQEQAWLIEREQLDKQQEDSTGRLQQLEASITELQQQLDEAQRAVAVTCPPPGFLSLSSAASDAAFGSTINVNNQELAALCEQQSRDASSFAQADDAFGGTININNQELAALCEQQSRDASSFAQADDAFGGTINVNNQELAALCEQQSRDESMPSLLAPRGAVKFNPEQLAAFHAREEHLQSRSDELSTQQQQLEEEQALVARQRIELESFHASLLELERALSMRAEALVQQASAQQATPAEPGENSFSHDDHDHIYGGEPERESNPLSESEAFAAMADQLAAMQQPKKDGPPALTRAPQDSATANEMSYDSPATFSSFVENESSSLADVAAESSPISAAEVEPEPSESQLEPTNAAVPPAMCDAESTDASDLVAPVAEDDFDRQLEARIARVMRRETNDWKTQPPPDANAEHAASDPSAAVEAAVPGESQAVNSVLDRLREAGLWKGEGTAKSDQLPSSNHPLDSAGPGLCRLSESGPIAGDPPGETAKEPEPAEVAESNPDDLSLIANPHPPAASLLSTPAKDDDADDSIESYMSRLMQRLRNTDDEPSPRKTSGSSPARASQARQSTAAPAALTPPKPKVTDSRPLTSLEELSPRSQPPELTSNLAAMREVANSAARGAIAVHQKANKRQKVNMRSANTLLAVLVSAGLLYFWTKTGLWIALGGAGLSLLWAIGSCLVAVIQSLTLRKADRKELQCANDEGTAE